MGEVIRRAKRKNLSLSLVLSVTGLIRSRGTRRRKSGRTFPCPRTRCNSRLGLRPRRGFRPLRRRQIRRSLLLLLFFPLSWWLNSYVVLEDDVEGDQLLVDAVRPAEGSRQVVVDHRLDEGSSWDSPVSRLEDRESDVQNVSHFLWGEGDRQLGAVPAIEAVSDCVFVFLCSFHMCVNIRLVDLDGGQDLDFFVGLAQLLLEEEVVSLLVSDAVSPGPS